MPRQRVRKAVRVKDVPEAVAIVIVVVAEAEAVAVAQVVAPVAVREATVVAIPAAVDAVDGKNSSQYSVPSFQQIRRATRCGPFVFWLAFRTIGV